MTRMAPIAHEDSLLCLRNVRSGGHLTGQNQRRGSTVLLSQEPTREDGAIEIGAAPASNLNGRSPHLPKQVCAMSVGERWDYCCAPGVSWGRALPRHIRPGFACNLV